MSKIILNKISINQLVPLTSGQELSLLMTGVTERLHLTKLDQRDNKRNDQPNVLQECVSSASPSIVNFERIFRDVNFFLTKKTPVA
eukprot:snap_masked-scaffold_89-processed-gene-0.26-mRNA-1 protein AED:1.00 eAED:1.00 QI:0/0/0/0/1/1/2/0/85